MSDIIIRKAKRDYVCNVCGHIIRKDSEYLDKVITHDGRAVRHERYHDECPCEDRLVKLFKEVMTSEFNLPVYKKSDGIKYRVVGFINGNIALIDWDSVGTDCMECIDFNTFFEIFNYEV